MGIIMCYLLEMYVNDIGSGITVADKEPSVVKETVATALVDGNNVLGPTVGNFAMELAVQKAKEAGVGWVTAKGKFMHILKTWSKPRLGQLHMCTYI